MPWHRGLGCVQVSDGRYGHIVERFSVGPESAAPENKAGVRIAGLPFSRGCPTLSFKLRRDIYRRLLCRFREGIRPGLYL